MLKELAYLRSASNREAVLQGNVNEVELERLVREFYASLACNDADGVRALLAEELEWWFHGPPSRRHLMRILNGTTRLGGSFSFSPQRVCTIGAQVLVEGQGKTPKVCWVHVWTVKNGLLAELREYFNTSLTVTGCRKEASPNETPQISEISPFYVDQTLWRTKFTDHSMPELILAI